MKKFQNENDVVLTMSKRELTILGLLVANGVLYARETCECDDVYMKRYRKIRDEICQ